MSLETKTEKTQPATACTIESRAIRGKAEPSRSKPGHRGQDFAVAGSRGPPRKIVSGIDPFPRCIARNRICSQKPVPHLANPGKPWQTLTAGDLYGDLYGDPWCRPPRSCL